ncbi:4-carboxy-4-hydroxy-2-oxoadipate aldolase/oxaloacetate decarboxylase [Actinoplanes solisilvae]|uniref:4-carboxy-4-hydroxy-2-oxoadipate aldolase/oxaloacetate decarboxylase n=1 Tax=Actinoplanes solisilvae TaxID=2486853 RepID=UPI000FD8A9B3|nr:4-carboxy-4-hydroxy-2-oxoadipate aldolase/oxaloacetate decarboxylase [Actinoplanes solisilvae]
MNRAVVNRHVVVRRVPRVAAEVLAGLASAGVSTVHEADGRRGALDPALRPIQTGARVAGSAVTVSCHPGDNLMIHAAVEVCAPGDLLVVTTTSPSTDGMVGELLAISLSARGVVGVVLDAGVRDVAELRAMGFPVWARAVSPRGTVKASPGSVNVPVVCGGQSIAAGDAVVADDDGVVVVPHSRANSVLSAARARLESETAKRARLAGGELGVDMYELRPLLDKLGVVYVDEAP